MITLALDGRAIRLSQYGLHLISLQIARSTDRRSLGRHVQDFGALRERRRLPAGDEAEEAAQGRQTAVASADRVAAFLLGISQEGAHFSSR